MFFKKQEKNEKEVVCARGRKKERIERENEMGCKRNESRKKLKCFSKKKEVVTLRDQTE
jgi:hypothetical protein